MSEEKDSVLDSCNNGRVISGEVYGDWVYLVIDLE
jgi:hypothetical protein